MPLDHPSRAESDANRSAATRARLLDAAFDCLVELGYARTTTVEICRRAQAPRGTLLHHYPNRDDLMLAALVHVLDRRAKEFDRAFERAVKRRARQGVEGPLPVDEQIDLLWKVISGPTMHAYLEVFVAARTDPALRPRFKREMAALDARFHEMSRGRLGTDPDNAAREKVGLSLAFALLNGLSLDSQIKPKKEVTAVLGMFKALARTLVPGEGAGSQRQTE